MSTTTTATTTAAEPNRPAQGAGAGLGFCRVTIVAPDGRVDVALPDDIPVADIYPEILRLAQQSPAEGAPVGYSLVRRDGTVLDSARSFAAQSILDGELLTLRPFSESLPPAVFDDVSEAVASAVTQDRTLWNAGLTRAAGLVAGGILPALLAFAAWSGDPRHDMHGLPGILAAVAGVLLLTLAAVRARIYDDQPSAVALGLGALPNIAVAGSGLLPLATHHGIGRLQALLACAAVLIAALVLTLLSPRGDGPFVACVLASAAGALVVFAAILTGMAPTGAAAICTQLAVGALAFLPGLSMRFARLPIGFAAPHSAQRGDLGDDADVRPVDAERIAAQARRGHELLVGLVGGCALLAVGGCAVLGFSDNTWGRLLALATGVALLMRAHLFRYTAQVAATLAAGLGALVLLGLGLCVHAPHDLMADALQGDTAALDVRTLWLVAAIAAAAALVTAIALIVPRRGVTPFWGRFLEIAEGFVLLTLLPLTLAVFDVYARARALTS
ncbi:type VII secretion integral membrane protein EccD [Streptomyces sp. ASQP_92]|uniref:type VII secretion integral membrane protein EccD n=1 Tax=Streptomyces sp. ASQP_92 TaxID=2979116 RepID=UPI0021C1D219|nr:type VII secretion integral membrane protein EccD [Streptomyces sp. ASQP_92]MCT9093292.1 type VII secretion integral membrane protein EccD [Streptomyces sp. ASQP_92]